MAPAMDLGSGYALNVLAWTSGLLWILGNLGVGKSRMNLQPTGSDDAIVTRPSGVVLAVVGIPVIVGKTPHIPQEKAIRSREMVLAVVGIPVVCRQNTTHPRSKGCPKS